MSQDEKAAFDVANRAKDMSSDRLALEIMGLLSKVRADQHVATARSLTVAMSDAETERRLRRAEELAARHSAHGQTVGATTEMLLAWELSWACAELRKR